MLEAGPGREAAVEGGVEHLLQARGQHEGQLLPHVRRDLLQVLLVPLGNDDSLQPSPVCCQHFVFNAPNLRRRRDTCMKTMNSSNDVTSHQELNFDGRFCLPQSFRKAIKNAVRVVARVLNEGNMLICYSKNTVTANNEKNKFRSAGKRESIVEKSLLFSNFFNESGLHSIFFISCAEIQYLHKNRRFLFEQIKAVLDLGGKES